MRTHGALTEDSLRTPIGKGREGKRKGREALLALSIKVKFCTRSEV